MVSQCRVIIERETETPAAFQKSVPEMALRQLGIFSQKCINSLKRFPESKKGSDRLTKWPQDHMKTKKKETPLLWPTRSFVLVQRLKNYSTKIYKAQNCRIELELHTRRDLVDQKLLANNTKQGQKFWAAVHVPWLALDLFWFGFGSVKWYLSWFCIQSCLTFFCWMGILNNQWDRMHYLV